MKPRSSIRKFQLAIGTVLLCAFPLCALAQDQTTTASFSANAKEAIPVNVLVGQSRVISFDYPIERFSVSNPEIAEAVLVTSNQVVVNGKAFARSISSHGKRGSRGASWSLTFSCVPTLP